MSMTAGKYVANVRDTLFDATPGAHWSDSELIRYLNAATRAIVALKPTAHTVIKDIVLDPGADQFLPSDGVMLLEVYSNTNNLAVTLQSHSEIARVRAEWETQGRGATSFVFYDPRAPRRFSVYPKASSGDILNAMYATLPDDVVNLSDQVDLRDTYDTAIWAFMCARALTKFGPRRDVAAAAGFMTTFTGFLDTVAKNEATLSVQVDLKGEGR